MMHLLDREQVLKWPLFLQMTNEQICVSECEVWQIWEQQEIRKFSLFSGIHKKRAS